MSRNCSYSCRSKQFGVGKVDERVQEDHALLLEEVALFGEGRLHGLRRGGHGGAGAVLRGVGDVAGEAIDNREEDVVERLLGVSVVEQVMHVRDAQLRREAGIDGAALGAFLVKLLGGEFGEDDVLRLDAERGEDSQ